jgi:predicted dehydrogenase
MIKIGVVGVGRLGKIHLKCLAELPEMFLVQGFYDIDPEVKKDVSLRFRIPTFDSFEEMLLEVDAVDVVTSTPAHFEIAKAALEAGKHVFIEKPVTQKLQEAEMLLQLSESKKLVGQVGHVERFNPALLSVQKQTLNPMFVEAHRLSMFETRGTDVPVVLDLMIHDIDIVLSLVQAPVKRIQANGVAVLHDTPDIANARIEFENGCVANLTASRISMKQMRKLRLFQKDAYLSLDFLKKESQVYRMYSQAEKPANGNFLELETADGPRFISMEIPEFEEVNAIKREFEFFAESIKNGAPVAVSLKDGYDALKIAYDIMQQIETSQPDY